MLFDAIEKKTNIQVRQGKQILETASNVLNELESQQKLSLNDLCKLTEEDVILQKKEVMVAKKDIEDQESNSSKTNKKGSVRSKRKSRSQKDQLE